MAAKKERQDKKSNNRQALTTFLILFPSVLIAGDYGTFITNIAIKAGLIFYQAVVLQSFLRSYYKLIE